jgi:RHS repeat-associated protein
LDLSYDALGNITNKSDVGNYTYHSTKKHQVTSTSNGWSFSYDNTGNMTSGRGATITWTDFNYPATIANGSDTSSFSYTPDRQYWRQISNYTNGGAATTIYVGGLLEKVTTGAGTDYRHMIRAGGASIIVSRQSSGTNSTRYVTRDHLGSNSAVTDGSGGVLVNSSFDAFGKRRGSNWTGSPSSGDWTAVAATTRRGYTDHSMLDNLSLIHMNGRVHDPVIGRFISADPFVACASSTQAFNRYSYVRNRPLSAVDPSGFLDDEIVVTYTREEASWAGAADMWSGFFDPFAGFSSGDSTGGIEPAEDVGEVVVTGTRRSQTPQAPLEGRLRLVPPSDNDSNFNSIEEYECWMNCRGEWEPAINFLSDTLGGIAGGIVSGGIPGAVIGGFTGAFIAIGENEFGNDSAGDAAGTLAVGAVGSLIRGGDARTGIIANGVAMAAGWIGFNDPVQNQLGVAAGALVEGTLNVRVFAGAGVGGVAQLIIRSELEDMAADDCYNECKR